MQKCFFTYKKTELLLYVLQFLCSLSLLPLQRKSCEQTTKPTFLIDRLLVLHIYYYYCCFISICKQCITRTQVLYFKRVAHNSEVPHHYQSLVVDLYTAFHTQHAATFIIYIQIKLQILAPTGHYLPSSNQNQRKMLHSFCYYVFQRTLTQQSYTFFKDLLPYSISGSQRK